MKGKPVEVEFIETPQAQGSGPTPSSYLNRIREGRVGVAVERLQKGRIVCFDFDLYRTNYDLAEHVRGIVDQKWQETSHRWGETQQKRREFSFSRNVGVRGGKTHLCVKVPAEFEADWREFLADLLSKPGSYQQITPL